MSQLTICIPSPKSPLAFRLAPGSAVVTTAQAADGQVKGDEATVYFEGNTIGAPNLQKFCQKLVCAAGRMMTRYPTSAMSMVPTDELIPVGTFDYEFKVVVIDRPDLVKAWEEGSGIFDSDLEDPAQVRLVMDICYDLHGVPVKDMKSNLRQAIEREIGNGALTGSTEAEVDLWTMEVL